MPAEIALRPNDDRGKEILDELEEETKVPPEVLEDGTRRYHASSEYAGEDAFNPMLDKIDRGWRNHITKLGRFRDR